MNCGNASLPAEYESVYQSATVAAKKALLPLSVTIELSTSCNLRCVHCYNFDRTDKSAAVLEKERKGDPLSPQEIKRLLAEIRVAGGLMVAFTGGEAMMHPHLVDFVKEARRLRLAVRLKTNGTLLTPERARELREAGVSDADFSLYGATSATHDAFTKVNGSFERTVRGIEAAKAVDIVPQVSFIMHRGCVSEFGEMRRLAQGRLGVAFTASMELTKRYDGSEGSLDHRLTKEDMRALYTGPERDFFEGCFNESDNVQCACAVTNAGIGSDGTVYPCIGAPIPSGNVREASFGEIWRGSKTFNWIRSLTLKDFKDCAPCDLRRHCERSSGAVYNNTGDYTGKEQWSCEQAALLRDLNEGISKP